jgi:hypothetical protein
MAIALSCDALFVRESKHTMKQPDVDILTRMSIGLSLQYRMPSASLKICNVIFPQAVLQRTAAWYDASGGTGKCCACVQCNLWE